MRSCRSTRQAAQHCFGCEQGRKAQSDAQFMLRIDNPTHAGMGVTHSILKPPTGSGIQPKIQLERVLSFSLRASTPALLAPSLCVGAVVEFYSPRRSCANQPPASLCNFRRCQKFIRNVVPLARQVLHPARAAADWIVHGYARAAACEQSEHPPCAAVLCARAGSCLGVFCAAREQRAARLAAHPCVPIAARHCLPSAWPTLRFNPPSPPQ